MKLSDRTRNDEPTELDPRETISVSLEDWLEMVYWAEIGMAYTQREYAGPLH